MIKTYIKRKKYLDLTRPFIKKEIIKVFVGQRRVGKSYLLYQIIDEIRRKNNRANIIYINKELHEFDRIGDYRALVKYVEEQKKGKTDYLFIDEIQDIADFEKALRHFFSRGGYDIYVTGSNSKLMSGELAGYLSGRYIEIPVYSLSYKEFLDFHGFDDSDKSLFKYIRYGGLPYLINLALDNEIVYSYLSSIYNTIVLKDVVARFNIRNVDFLDRLIIYLADNTGSLVSAKKISDFLKSQKISISPNSVLNYLDNLKSSCFIQECERMDIKGKKIFEISEKYYFTDLGLRHTLVGYKQADINKILENLVYNHLKYSGYKVNVGQMDKQEVDFVASRGDKRIYVQAAYMINNDKTKKREFGNLLAIPDSHRKIVVSMDPGAGGNVEGVEHVNIREFLMG